MTTLRARGALMVMAALTTAGCDWRPAPKSTLAQELRQDQPQELCVPLGPDHALRFSLVPAGWFNMGSMTGNVNEQPVHKVTLTQRFYLGIHEVTQAQYRAVLGENPSAHRDPAYPVTNVTWHDAAAFCQRLSRQHGVTFRLPTEAEWEYACRAGTETPYYWGQVFSWHGGWCNLNSSGRPHRVGKKLPNAWGLHDMCGNVFEWCQDRYASGYPHTDQVDPAGPGHGDARVLRGGCYRLDPTHGRSAARFAHSPRISSISTGFRVAMDPGE